MNFMLPIQIAPPATKIEHQHPIVLMGSCFTEHMSKRLEQSKFRTVSNPFGILFNPISVVQNLRKIIQKESYTTADLFHLNELWNSWDHHSDFSHFNAEDALAKINSTIASTHQFLQQSEWLIITLGSSFQYFLTQEPKNYAVANCHRAPSAWFDKRLLSIATITDHLQQVIAELKVFNPRLKIIFTISPVRHIRDGVVENNRSKARLLEAVHQLVDDNAHCFYFPAYELAIDVLRDYRFYDVDMVHPNYACTQFIWEHFVASYFSDECKTTADAMKEIATAFAHRTRFPETEAHQKFLLKYVQKIQILQKQYSYLDFSDELQYFRR